MDSSDWSNANVIRIRHHTLQVQDGRGAALSSTVDLGGAGSPMRGMQRGLLIGCQNQCKTAAQCSQTRSVADRQCQILPPAPIASGIRQCSLAAALPRASRSPPTAHVAASPRPRQGALHRNVGCIPLF